MVGNALGLHLILSEIFARPCAKAQAWARFSVQGRQTVESGSLQEAGERDRDGGCPVRRD